VPVESQLAKQLLDAEGIPAFLIGYETVSADWLLSNAVGGIQLQVPEEQAEDAIDFLSQAGKFGQRALGDLSDADDDSDLELDHESDDDDNLDGGRELVLQEHSGNLREATIQRAYRSAIFSLVFQPLAFYTLYLLLRAFVDEQPLRPEYRRKLWLALAIHLPILIMMLVIVRTLLRIITD
jgi:hypothetical protein